MLTSDHPEVAAAQIIFLLLLPLVLFAPLRWAVLAWLLMGNLDTTGGSSTVASGVGWMNAAKGVLFPLYLWWRLRYTPGTFLSELPARLWLLLAAYAAISGIWSPFPLAAAKMVGNMVGILLSFIALERAARRGLIGPATLMLLIAGSLLLAVGQTVAFNEYGFDGIGRPTRLTSFVTAQQYAAFLVAFLAATLWHPGIRSTVRTVLVPLLFVALILNGSRTWFLGAVLVVLIYLLHSHVRILAYVSVLFATLAFGILLLFNLDSHREDLFSTASGRIMATARAVLTGVDTPEHAGLANLNFRLIVYEGALSEIKSASLAHLLLGHGTSSGGNVVMRVFPRAYKPDTLDPNRVLHNEWLRAFYEWGLGGFLAVIAVFTTLVAGLLRRYKTRWARAASMIALSFAPAFLLAFSTENLIAGAGNAVTMSLALLVSLSWTPFAQLRRAPGHTHAHSASH